MCTISIVCNRIEKSRIVVTMNNKKNEIGFVGDAKGNHWEEMKLQMLLLVDGQLMVTRTLVTRTLTACSRKCCGFTHITLLVM